MQRLFSNFANGWPGVGLLLQRVLASVLLLRFGVTDLSVTPFSIWMILQFIAVCVGVLFMIGLWTPLTGLAIAVLEIGLALTNRTDPWMAIILGVFGVTAAMIGPGAHSVDAHLFGRRRFEA